jgi:hypothetical protein
MEYQQPVINIVALARDALQNGGPKVLATCYDEPTHKSHTAGAYDVDE